MVQRYWRGRQARKPPSPGAQPLILVIRRLNVYPEIKMEEKELGFPDPYLVIESAGMVQEAGQTQKGMKPVCAQTTVKRSNKTPHWNDLNIELWVAPAPTLTIKLFDEGEAGQATLLGFGKLRLFARRGRVPCVRLTPTAAHCLDELCVAFEYDRYAQVLLWNTPLVPHSHAMPHIARTCSTSRYEACHTDRWPWVGAACLQLFQQPRERALLRPVDGEQQCTGA